MGGPESAEMGPDWNSAARLNSLNWLMGKPVALGLALGMGGLKPGIVDLA